MHQGVTVVAVAALLVSFATLLYLRRQTRSGERSEAREEAIELAEVRGRVIEDLEGRIAKLEREQEREREDHQKEINLLKQVIEHVRREAAETQRLLTVGFRGVTLKVLGHLEADPAEVEAAVSYLRDMLNGDEPPPQPMRRAA